MPIRVNRFGELGRFRSSSESVATADTLSVNTGCEQLQQSSPLFDHLVGAAEQYRWNSKAERLRGRDVYDEIELGRLLGREVQTVSKPLLILTAMSPAGRSHRVTR